MIIRQLKQEEYKNFCNSLKQKADTQPLDASYTVKLTVNEAEYAIKLQPERHFKIAILQALRIYRSNDGPDFELITRGNLLSSFLELIVTQGIGSK